MCRHVCQLVCTHPLYLAVDTCICSTYPTIPHPSRILIHVPDACPGNRCRPKVQVGDTHLRLLRGRPVTRTLSRDAICNAESPSTWPLSGTAASCVSTDLGGYYLLVGGRLLRLKCNMSCSDVKTPASLAAIGKSELRLA